jgi:uncharacterized membrane protein
MTSEDQTIIGGAAHRTLDTARRLRDAVRRAFAEFLGVPTATITAFVVLAGLVYLLDRFTPGWMQPARDLLQQHVFIDAATTADVLTAIAAGIITVTSITVSVLLLAVQQSAGSMSSAVLDQFLRRRQNQLSFGFFTGLALYTLVTLATVHQSSNAVFGATLAVLLTVAALYALLLLLYSTVNQMRPSAIVGSIVRLTLQARRRQERLLERTRRRALVAASAGDVRVTAAVSGYVTRVDLAPIEAIAPRLGGSEVVLGVSIGSFVSLGDEIAAIRSGSAGAAWSDALTPLIGAVRRAVHVEFDRDIASDATYGISQIHAIGWTSISSSKSSPGPGVITIRALRDLMARWLAVPPELRQHGGEPSASETPSVLPVVYPDDTIGQLFDALESFGIVAGESKQHRSLAEVLRTVAVLVPRLPEPYRARAAELVERLLPTLHVHVRSAALDDALELVAERLDVAGEATTADLVRQASRAVGARPLPPA